jgi:hypothetical protein
MSLSFPTPVSRSSPDGASLSVDRFQAVSRRALHEPSLSIGFPAHRRPWQILIRLPAIGQPGFHPARQTVRSTRCACLQAHGTSMGPKTTEPTEHEERVARSAGAPSPAYAPELGGLRKAVTQRQAKVPGRPGSRPSPRATGSLGSIWAGPDFSLEGQIPLAASGALGAQGTFKTWKGAVPVWNGQSPASPGQGWKHGYSHRSG